MEQEVVQTKLTDSKYAADDLCKQLRNQPESYNCIIFFAATSVNFQELQSELSQRFTKAQVVGATTSGEITPQGFANNSVVLNAILLSSSIILYSCHHLAESQRALTMHLILSG